MFVQVCVQVFGGFSYLAVGPNQMVTFVEMTSGHPRVLCFERLKLGVHWDTAGCLTHIMFASLHHSPEGGRR